MSALRFCGDLENCSSLDTLSVRISWTLFRTLIAVLSLLLVQFLEVVREERILEIPFETSTPFQFTHSLITLTLTSLEKVWIVQSSLCFLQFIYLSLNLFVA